MQHIITVQAPLDLRPSAGYACGECQTSCQSACKTSCTVANQPCENNER